MLPTLLRHFHSSMKKRSCRDKVLVFGPTGREKKINDKAAVREQSNPATDEDGTELVDFDLFHPVRKGKREREREVEKRRRKRERELKADTVYRPVVNRVRPEWPSQVRPDQPSPARTDKIGSTAQSRRVT